MPAADEVIWSEVEEAAQPVAEEEPPVSLSGQMPDRWSLLELRLWMDDSRRMLIETIEGRTPKSSASFRSNPLLERPPPLPRVGEARGIRAGMQQRVDSLREQDGEWQKRITWVENLERVSATWESRIEPEESGIEGVEAPASEPLVEPVESETESPAEGLEVGPPEQDIPEPPAPSPHLAPIRREDIYLFYYSGRPFALSASSVVKSQQISRSNAQKILKRRYATLADVKPLFRSIRTGVSGKLATMPGKVLKTIEFDVIGPNYFQVAQAPSDPRVAIFVTPAATTASFWPIRAKTESRANAEIVLETCSCHAAIGTVSTKSGLCAEVLDVWHLFRDGEPAPVGS